MVCEIVIGAFCVMVKVFLATWVFYKNILKFIDMNNIIHIKTTLTGWMATRLSTAWILLELHEYVDYWTKHHIFDICS